MVPSWLCIALLAIASFVAAERKCYGDLGCFETLGGFKSLPQEPSHVQTEFHLYTRQNRGSAKVIKAVDPHSAWNSAIKSSHFSGSKPTKFIIHGFINDINTAWLKQTKDALLNHGDYNVIIVGWGHGSKFPYEQATANVFLVSAQVAKFIQNLHSTSHLQYGDVHLIGHSLGAQACGIVGSKVRTIGRITGMDPAQPSFDHFDTAHHLDPSDAHFVDVIHSDGADFTGIAGYGWLKPLGHIDFYPNSGMDQPGCADNPIGSAIGNILGGHIKGIGSSLSCSHGRSHEFFLESINSHCKFLGHKCGSWADYEAGKCHGCSGGCPEMGLNADKSNARGSFYLSTAQSSPFCGTEYFVEVDVDPKVAEAYGRFYITLHGSSRSTSEVEFSRQNTAYSPNKRHEKHLISVHEDVGTVTGVDLKFKKGGGLHGIGEAHDIKVSSVTIRKQTSSSTVKFCDNGKTLFKDNEKHSLRSKC